MATLRQRRRIPTGGAHVDAVVHRPRTLPARGGPTVLVLAHGAGGDMHHALLVAVAERCAADGAIVVRVNFPYTTAGRRAPDRMPVLERTLHDVVAWVRRQRTWRARRVVVGGKSMGGRAASRCVAAEGDARLAADGLVLLGYPLHPSGETATLRVEHLAAIPVPSLFVQGTRDTLCDLALLLPALAAVDAPVSLHIVHGGDHSFHVPVRTCRGDEEVYAEIAAAVSAWVRTTVA